MTKEIGSNKKAYWQYPLPTGSVAERYISGPLPDGSGDQDAIIQMDPRFTPWAPPFVVKQMPPTLAGTVHGGMQQYSTPRLLVWLSLNSQDQMDLGGTVTLYLGEELEQHAFTSPTLVYVPANTPHGVVVYGKDFTLPFLHIDSFPEGRNGEPTPRPDLDRRLPDFAQGFPDKTANPPGGLAGWNPAGGGIYGKYFFSGNHPDSLTPLPASQVRLLPGEVPDLPLEKSFLFLANIEGLELNDVPMHITHAHPCNENLICFSPDANQPHDLGCKVIIYAFDTEIKKLVPVEMSKPFISSSARGRHLHCPMVRREMTRPLGFIWYTCDYDPRAFDMGPRGGVAMQMHNEHYTEGRFNMAEYGVREEDLPEEPEGDGGFLTMLEPHLDWPIARGHNGTYAPPLKIPPKARPKHTQAAAPLLPPGNAAGSWQCESISTRGPPLPGHLVLRVEGNVLLGEFVLGEISLPIIGGHISGDHLTFGYELPGKLPIPMKVDATLNGDTLQGTVGASGMRKAPFTGTRRSSAQSHSKR